MKLIPITIAHGGSVSAEIDMLDHVGSATVVVDYDNGDVQVVTIPSDLSARDFGIGMDRSNSESSRKMKNIRFI